MVYKSNIYILLNKYGLDKKIREININILLQEFTIYPKKEKKNSIISMCMCPFSKIPLKNIYFHLYNLGYIF